MWPSDSTLAFDARANHVQLPDAMLSILTQTIILSGNSGSVKCEAIGTQRVTVVEDYE